MEKIEAKLRELEEDVIQVKIQMQTKDQGLEHQKKAIVDHMDKEFATHKLVMNEIVEGAKTEFTAQRFNLQKLNEVTSIELERMKERLEEMERKRPLHEKSKFLAAKN